MSEFERPIPLTRIARTNHGDDLQAVAARELGDANRWPELVWLNNLVWPYLTDDDRRVKPGVILNGGMIRVPAPAGFAGDQIGRVESGAIYERDCTLERRRLVADGFGDFAVSSGVDNLSQQLRHRINTPRGQARRHPDYGCMVWRMLGTVTGPAATLLAAEYVKATLLSDYRVSSVTKAEGETVGDGLRVRATAVAISGDDVDVDVTPGVVTP